MELKVYNKSGEETGRVVNLPDSIFNVEVNNHAIYLDVKQYMANQRQGTHKTKEKGEIAHSTRKIKKQKGTGSARAGSIKSGVMVGGGRFHGPRPRSYSFKLNKKLKAIARFSALTYKAKENHIKVLEDVSFETPNTKSFTQMLQNLNVNGTRTLFVTPAMDKNTYLSGRNIPKNRILPAAELNTYEIVKAKNLLLTESSVDALVNHFNK
jgi:large subunit ribosomal protein L4